MTEHQSHQTESNTPASSSSPNQTSRVEAFADGVASLDVPVVTPRAESGLLWGGIAAVAVGIILVVAGYWGASGTGNVADQMPYMLSGGAIGLALVIIGSVLIGRYSMAKLFRFWLALLVAEHRAQTDRLVDALNGSGATRQ